MASLIKVIGHNFDEIRQENGDLVLFKENQSLRITFHYTRHPCDWSLCFEQKGMKVGGQECRTSRKVLKEKTPKNGKEIK